MCIGFIRRSDDVALLAVFDVIRVNPWGPEIPELEIFVNLAFAPVGAGKTRASLNRCLEFVTRGHVYDIEPYSAYFGVADPTQPTGWLAKALSVPLLEGWKPFLSWHTQEGGGAACRSGQRFDFRLGRVAVPTVFAEARNIVADTKWADERCDVPLWSTFSTDVEFSNSAVTILPLRYRLDRSVSQAAVDGKLCLYDSDGLFARLEQDVSSPNCPRDEAANLASQIVEWRSLVAPPTTTLVGARRSQPRHAVMIAVHPAMKRFQVIVESAGDKRRLTSKNKVTVSLDIPFAPVGGEEQAVPEVTRPGQSPTLVETNVASVG
jgi:hypothetical protein